MKAEIKIPALGESITEAVVSQILKSSGSFVKRDEELLELETDKVNRVLHAPQNGTLTLHVKKDDVVKIGQLIGFVDTEGKATAPASLETPQAKPEQPPSQKELKPAP